jgi:hypothetical protein
MGWLVGYTLGSMAAAYVVVRVFDYVVSGVADSASSAARGSVFISTWAAVTARSGMRGLTRTARQLRRRNAVATKRLDTLTKGERR